MKPKLIIIFLILIGLAGCSNKTDNLERNYLIELNHEELMMGDFSAIAGEYINSKEEIFFLNNEGLRDNGEFSMSDVYYINGIYQMNLWQGDTSSGSTGGYAITIYPVGIEIEGLVTDTTKIRISYGQAEPMSEEEIYTKK